MKAITVYVKKKKKKRAYSDSLPAKERIKAKLS
jgi:hypothetical protein